MEDETNLALDKPCPSCGKLNLKECKNCGKVICLNCSNYVEHPKLKTYLCENCYIELRKKTIRVI